MITTDNEIFNKWKLYSYYIIDYMILLKLENERFIELIFTNLLYDFTTT